MPKIGTPDAFEQAPLTDLELGRFRELVRQHPRDIYCNTLAVAEYRMGNYRQSVDAALRSIELSPQAHPVDYAILAMSYSGLGETGQAKDCHEKLLDSMKLDGFRDDAECKSFQAEVERTFLDSGAANGTGRPNGSPANRDQSGFQPVHYPRRHRLSQEPARPLQIGHQRLYEGSINDDNWFFNTDPGGRAAVQLLCFISQPLFIAEP